uniref:CHK kinase-like domain-containing protein n=1 Tax=Acrobeloides nanus TaxID=290746 RepID=A0A914CII9_9BILA
MKYSHANCCDDLGIPKVVCHGDLWISNILWSKDQSEAEIKTFIDFAGTFEGNPMFDFAMILTCTDTITRRKIEKEFIEKYFDDLKNNIRFDNFEQFNIEKLKKAYGLAMTYCASRMATAATFHKEPKQGYGNEEHEKNLVGYLDRTKFAVEDAVDFMEENFSTFFIKTDCKPVYPTIRF